MLGFFLPVASRSEVWQRVVTAHIKKLLTLTDLEHLDIRQHFSGDLVALTWKAAFLTSL